ncbi:putative ubiquitin conjugating enzyme [Podospora appendiculata]|uniref:Ubiquitin conjugating enzyme n=1 Tax=Podospora appendiculata TaxID=314037 RepID=A0AAE0X973_9PEZI|nr:putative ubiquitin conjugating enzyme [Podospora appendiculata]
MIPNVDILSFASVAHVKRAFTVSDGAGQGQAELPKWALAVMLLDVIIFFPIFIFTSYSLGSLYPVLSIVEDPNPPAYEPLATEENSSVPTKLTNPAKPVTSSLRAISRHLRSIAGWKSNFRGFAAAIALSTLTSFVTIFFGGVTRTLASLLASLALVQLSTAWVHIVISTPNPRSFYRRLPALRTTFAATYLPVTIFWAATTASVILPTLVAAALGIKTRHQGADYTEVDRSLFWKTPIVILVGLAVQALAVIPARVVLVRVQASLLPVEEDAIVPFDRSFQGKLEPAVVGGKGYISMSDAWKTFSRASWIRLYKLHVKVFAVSMATTLLFAAFVIPQFFLIPYHKGKN